MTKDAKVSFLARSRYAIESGPAYLTGIQALARLPLDQRRLDARAGLDTAGFVSGYRGSPLGGLDRELWGQQAQLTDHRVVFQPGVNEDLAATAVWGTQQVGLFPGARHDGVFGLWYGKTPGLDRSMDAVRHANAAGTNPVGGVLMAVGDDHGCKSSTMPGASEFALRDLGIPVLAPAHVGDVLDFGLFGWALSRYAGCWVGLVVVTDVADSAMTVDIDLDRYCFPAPVAGADVHIRLTDSPLAQEERAARKLVLATEFATENGINRIVTAPEHPRLAVVSAGKAYADVREGLARLGMGNDRQVADAGIRLAKLGMTWPLATGFVHDVCRDVDCVLVVEEKRPFIEEQMKSILFGGRPIRLVGKAGADTSAAVFPASGEIDAVMIARAVSTCLQGQPVANGGEARASSHPTELGYSASSLAASRIGGGKDAKELRKPLYCAGCPHNVSTRVPAGSRAVAGIGCHYMAQWMDRDTYTPTQMGGEGANWIGQAPFTDEGHIFVNLGDGTYFHSGILAIRAAVSAGVNVTYKLLFNDAVAMTGGQPVDGRLSVADVVAQVRAEGVAAVRVVSDQPRRHRGLGVRVSPRTEFDAVQRELRATPGCTVLIYEQTCATELRRRRKRGKAVDPDVRVVINDAVCEGCGDCSVQSNCVAVAPLATEFGVKRSIDQSACNKDLSCLAGFCPSFVTLTGARFKRTVPDPAALDGLKSRLPAPPGHGPAANIVIAGIGGTGIVTGSQLLGMAAHLDGRFVSTLDMTGLAQKGGAVVSHVRMSPAEAQHSPTRIPAGGADVMIAADLVTLAGRDTLSLMSRAHTNAIVNTHLAPTTAFVLQQAAPANAGVLQERAAAHARDIKAVDAEALSVALFGTSACANVLLLGYAFQVGLVPVTLSALERAIALNGVAVADNLAALHYGRAAAHDPALLPEAARTHSEAMQRPTSRTLDDRIARRRAFLVRYQDEALAMRFEDLVDRVRAAERRVKPQCEVLAEAVAEAAFRLYSVKDEYEVARLFTEGVTERVTEGALRDDADFATKLGRRFEPGFKIKYHFAPPFLARFRDADGRPKKIAVGGWVTPALRLLARLRKLRGGAFDVFRYLPERRLERELVARFEADVDLIVAGLTARNLDSAVALVRLSDSIKGFGPVKAAAARAAESRHPRLLADFLAVSPRTTMTVDCQKGRVAVSA